MKTKTTRIGITLPDIGTGVQAFWGSGLVQNAALLARTLEKIENVKVYATNNFKLAKELKMEYTSKGPGYLHMVIEVGGKLTPSAAQALRSEGGLLIHHVLGNTMVLNMEHLASGGLEGSPDIPYGYYDAVWCLPHTFGPNVCYYQMMHRCPVLKVPMIWAPDFLPKTWSYVEQGHKIIGCFEPSVSVVKTPHMSILVTEEAARQLNPRVDELRVFAAQDKLDRSSAFQSFIGSLQIVDRTVFLPRTPIAQAMPGLSAVVAHQWMNDLNYNWFEALYGGFPLVHNSPMVQAGYYYPEFDTQVGGKLLHHVLESHSSMDKQYREHSRNFLSIFSPDAVRSKYAELIEMLQVMRK